MALREINLIAPDILERRYLLRHLFLWCGAIGATVVLALAVYGYGTRILYAAKQDLPNGSNPKTVLTAMVSEISREQRELNLALRQRAQFGALVATQRSYSLAIAKLTEAMNRQTWLQQLVIDTGKDRIAHLKLLGSSITQEDLGDFVQRLSVDPLFRGVVLKYSQESEVRTTSGGPVQFQIECTIAGE